MGRGPAGAAGARSGECGAASPVPLADTASSPPAPAGTLGCGSADPGMVLLYQNLSSGLEFCPVSLTANLVQFLGNGAPVRIREVCRDFCWGRCSSAGDFRALIPGLAYTQLCFLIRGRVQNKRFRRNPSFCSREDIEIIWLHFI